MIRKIPRCQSVVYKRDTLRYSGRTKSGFEMHYRRCQCQRRATDSRGLFCWQHAEQDGTVQANYSRYMNEFVKGH